MMKAHILRRAYRDAAICIPLYEQSRVNQSLFPELATFDGSGADSIPGVIDAYATCVQVQTVLIDCHRLLAQYLADKYTRYLAEHPVRYWFIGDVVPLEHLVFVQEVDVRFRDLVKIKDVNSFTLHDVACLHHRCHLVRKWMKDMVKLIAEMQEAVDTDTVQYRDPNDAPAQDTEDNIVVDAQP